MTRTARIFKSGGSDAVRLPAEFRFGKDVREVSVRRDERTGEVILAPAAPANWEAFMAMRDSLAPIPDDFMADREQGTSARDPFQDWRE